MTKSVQKAEYGKKRNRKIILLCLLILVLAVGSIAGMKAYFVDMQSRTNTFTVGEAAVQASVSEGNLVVTNTGSVDCYIRVFAEMERPEMVLTATENTGDGNGWSTKQTDGYYYYQTSVAPGAYTTALFTGLSAEAGAELIVYAECVQSKAIGKGPMEAFATTQ